MAIVSLIPLFHSAVKSGADNEQAASICRAICAMASDLVVNAGKFIAAGSEPALKIVELLVSEQLCHCLSHSPSPHTWLVPVRHAFANGLFYL